jgi:signal transduction histidine kinase/ActR/RegA family two-component response regulator
MAHAYLNGTAIKDMPPVLNSPNDFALDAQVLTYKHIQPSEDILQQATILNPNISFYEREKSLILGIIYVLVMIVLLGTVIAVRVLLRKNKQLNIAQQQSEAASQAKSEFLGSMSHELRTPLNAILGFSQLITLEAENNAEITDFSQEIERAGNHLLSLVNDLIDLSRIESGKLDIVFEPVLLSSLEKDCLALVAPLSEKFHVHLAIQSAEMDVVILADPVRLRQVIINFLSNGIKYNKLNGSVTLQTSIHQNIVRIQVIDTGIGIPADKQARIFSAFDRLGAECGTIEGSGIGLVITQRLIEAMGGSIGFSSVEHQGTSFWVDFPIHEQRAHTINDHNKPTPSTNIVIDDLTQQSNLPSILCIEDNSVNLKILQKILSKKGNYQLYEAVNAIEGIHLAKSLRPNIILSDINLPDMDGYQILTLLKADPDTSHIPIVALTADAMKEDIERGEAAGFAGYVTKPIDIPTLFALIDRLLTH